MILVIQASFWLVLKVLTAVFIDSAHVSATTWNQNRCLLKDILVQHYSSLSSFTQKSCEVRCTFFSNAVFKKKNIYLKSLQVNADICSIWDHSLSFRSVWKAVSFSLEGHSMATCRHWLSAGRVVVERGDKWQSRKTQNYPTVSVHWPERCARGYYGIIFVQFDSPSVWWEKQQYILSAMMCCNIVRGGDCFPNDPKEWH